MTKARDSSDASAARFLAVRKTVERREPEPERPPRQQERRPGGRPSGKPPGTVNAPKPVVPAAWNFVEKHVPGAYAAWMRDVRLPVSEFSLGVTGRPKRAQATERKCIDSGCRACTRCRRLINGRWFLVEHEARALPASAAWPDPHVDEHW